MTANAINSSFLKLFQEHPDAVYAPITYAPMKRGALVFVGLNPSFSVDGWAGILKHWTGTPINPAEYFLLSNQGRADAQVLIALEKLAQKHYSFYGPHRCLAGKLSLDWEHIDIFAYREKTQKNIEAACLSEDGNLAPFWLSMVLPKIRTTC